MQALEDPYTPQALYGLLAAPDEVKTTLPLVFRNSGIAAFTYIFRKFRSVSLASEKVE